MIAKGTRDKEMVKFGTKLRTWKYIADELCVRKIEEEEEEEDGENWRSGEFKLGMLAMVSGQVFRLVRKEVWISN